MTYYKYIIPTEDLPEWDELPRHDKVNLGFVITQEGEWNDEGEEITPQVFDETQTKVDVVWHENEPEGFEQYRVIPKVHEHWYAGMEELFYECNATD